MKKLSLLKLVILLSTVPITAQVINFSSELRPRYEYRHGFIKLISPEYEAASFVSQRTRLNVDYKSDKFNIFFAIQNIRVWGDVPTMNLSDNNGIVFHQAWAEYFFNDWISMKLGRQEIEYDDERMFGAVDWAQQARSHDALLIKIKTGKKGNLHFGFALNANRESLFGEDYIINQYKSLQYAWYHTSLSESLGLSALFLNNGMPYTEFNDKQKITFSQTIGTRLTYKKNRIIADGATYFQMGNTPNRFNDESINLSAFYFTLNTKFKITDKFTAGAGIEVLSGNDQNSNETKDKAFKPFYGTNHKFNGWMDYFYVGSYMNSVGLMDINIPISYKKNKFSATVIPHFFSAQGNVYDRVNRKVADPYLGTEIDMVLGYKVHKSIMLKVGYSQMFATETMEILKGGSKDETNNWAWVMIAFKPNFFTHSFNK